MTVAEQRSAVVAEALSWLGTPWHHAARIKGVGVDCGQLLIASFAVVGIDIGEVAAYRQDWGLHGDKELMRDVVERRAKPLPSGRRPEPGDVALFRFGRCMSHASIVVEWPKIVHAYLFARHVVIDDVDAVQSLKVRLGGVWSCWGETT